MTQNYRNIFDLAGKTVIVTGAAAGLGREIALALADFKAHVVVADINADSLNAVAGEIEKRGAKAVVAVTDVSDELQVGRMVAAAKAVTGVIDALVHCAGIGGRSTAEEYPMELWDKVMAVNADGTFLCSQTVGRVMLGQPRGGSIVNLSSVGGVVGKPGSVAYQVGKAIEIQLVKSLGVEWAPRGVRVNSIAPGPFLTDTIREELLREPTMNDQLMKNLPMKRSGELSEIVGAALYLCSDASSYVTGTVLAVDGGILAS